MALPNGWKSKSNVEIFPAFSPDGSGTSSPSSLIEESFSSGCEVIDTIENGKIRCAEENIQISVTNTESKLIKRKKSKSNVAMIIKELVVGEVGVNAPTASMRNTIKPSEANNAGETMPKGWKSGMNEDENVPKGWKDGKPATPASSSRRKWGKLTKKEIISNKKSCHNIQGMFLKKMEHLPSVSVTLGEGQESILLGPEGDGQTSSLLGATASKYSTFVQPLGSPEKPLSTRRGFTNFTNITNRKKKEGFFIVVNNNRSK